MAGRRQPSWNPMPVQFQLDLPAEKFQGPRAAVLADIAAALTHLQGELPVRVGVETLRTSVFTQQANAVSTLNGRPLWHGKHSGPVPSYDWNGVGILRWGDGHAWPNAAARGFSCMHEDC